MDNITGEFGDVGKMAPLSGGPQQRGMEKGKGKLLMIGKKDKLTALEGDLELVVLGWKLDSGEVDL